MTDALPPWLEGLHGPHLPSMITSDKPVIRVVAGPGSGKTTGLKRRVQRLVEGEAVPHEQIFVGTFTRAIAADLRSELGEDIKVSTLHSLAYEMLRDHPSARQGYALRFLLGYEEQCLLYDIAGDVTHLRTLRDRQDALLRQQSARSERRALPDAQFAGAVANWLRDHNGMLIGEVVHLVTTALDAEDIPRGQYDHVVVDEYQDLTAAEQELVELIWSQRGSLVVLGDDNQSIYGFRFNHPGGIGEFATKWPSEDFDDLGIPENRRCGERIVHLANQMMAEAGSSNAPMEARSGREGDTSFVQWPTIDAEIDGLARYINSQPDKSFLVMVPRRFIGHRLKDRIGSDARTSFHQEVLEHKLVQERFAAASVVADPEDRVAIRGWLGLHGNRSEHGDERNRIAYASLRNRPERGRGLLEAIVTGAISVSGAGQQNVRSRAVKGVELLEAVPPDLIDRITYLFDPALADGIEEGEKREWVRRDLQQLRDAALAVAGRADTLAKVMSALRYRIATRAPLTEDEGEPRVQIMTLHSAKGLQGDNIVIAGAAEQIIPAAADDQSRAEQRRLLYVAITRARNELIVSWPRRVTFADAMANGVRIDSVITADGNRVVQLARSSLLPQSLGGVVAGAAWLRDCGVPDAA
jgi:DNA helicase II / ATP-dependent DNA helicase PcrA